MNRNYKFSNRSLMHIGTTTPLMQKICNMAMDECNARLMDCPDWGVSEGLRTTIQQQQRFAIGRNSLGHIIDKSKVVTYRNGVSRKSDHQSGDAVDIFAVSENGKTDYSIASMCNVFSCFAVAVMKHNESDALPKLSLEWGGSYTSFVDACHIAIKRLK